MTKVAGGVGLRQCCGSVSVIIRNFLPDPDPIQYSDSHSDFESGSENGSEINQKNDPYM
jgi:hypothetical protein